MRTLNTTVFVLFSLFFTLFFYDHGFASATTLAKPADVAVCKHMAKPRVHDSKLQQIVQTLYRPQARIGSGSTADAIRYEQRTGQPIKGKSHLKKGRESITHLQKWVKKHPMALEQDVTSANALISDLQDALGSPRTSLRE